VGRLSAFLRSLTGTASPPADTQSPLHDPDRLMILDAEDLAEGGIATAYARVCGRLRAFVPQPLAIEEHNDVDGPAYAVTAGGLRYEIAKDGTREDLAWGAATFALFDIVNRQLQEQDVRFYAVNGGNDLFGIFLTAEEHSRAIASLAARSDWPYLPTRDPPEFGQPR
jgi:hypothetical protein